MEGEEVIMFGGPRASRPAHERSWSSAVRET